MDRANDFKGEERMTHQKAQQRRWRAPHLFTPKVAMAVAP